MRSSQESALCLSSATLIQTTLSQSISVISTLILFSHPRVRFASGLRPSGLPTKAPYTSLVSYVLRVQPISSFCLDHPNNNREEYKLLSFLLSIYSSFFYYFLRAERAGSNTERISCDTLEGFETPRLLLAYSCILKTVPATRYSFATIH